MITQTTAIVHSSSHQIDGTQAHTQINRQSSPSLQAIPNPTCSLWSYNQAKQASSKVVVLLIPKPCSHNNSSHYTTLYVENKRKRQTTFVAMWSHMGPWQYWQERKTQIYELAGQSKAQALQFGSNQIFSDVQSIVVLLIPPNALCYAGIEDNVMENQGRRIFDY